MEIKQILEKGTISNASYCEVIQIILYQKSSKNYWNYFTHITFDESFVCETERKWLTDSPHMINKDIKVMISKQVLSREMIISILDNASESQRWILGEDEALLDEVFVVDPLYVPETDPTGSTISDNTLVPLELSLYGSNYSGNYYIVELFSTKNTLGKLLNNNDKEKIQDEIKKANLQYDLYGLSDRIGNILCKLNVDVMEHHHTRLSPERGIAGRMQRVDNDNNNYDCYLQVMSSNDHILVNNYVIPFSLNDDTPSFEYSLEPNRYKNIITVTDQHNGLIYFSAEHDYSYGSDYYATISPPNYLITVPSKRRLTIDGENVEIELAGVSGIGEISIQKEIFETELRQKMWRDKQLVKQGYFNAFEIGDSEKAISVLRAIINDKNLLWDLDEVWLIDPYLSSYDILKTVVFCSKRNINVKCLTNIGGINGNKDTRESVEGDRFTETKALYAHILKEAIPNNTDIRIEYRTIRGNNGKVFHDRYLVLKYKINKCRVWSLGISVNSLGTSHHIVQIVESPSSVAAIIEEIWNSTENDECLIYKNW